MKLAIATLILMGLAPECATTAASELRVVAKKDQSAVSGDVLARDVLTEGKLPDGRTVVGGLFVLFHPSTGYFSWTHGVAAPSPLIRQAFYDLDELQAGRMFTYVDQGGLVIFKVSLPPMEILVRRATEKASSIDDAEAKALKLATDQLGSPQGPEYRGWKRVALADLGRDFITPKMSATFAPAKIVSVSKHDGNWEIVLEDQWKEKVTLNEKFEVLNLSRED